MAREYTQEEVLNQFVEHCHGMVEYWTNLIGQQPAGYEEPIDGARAVDGVVFSLLAALDGSSMGLPGFIVAPSPHEDDKEYQKGRDENWYPQNHDSDVKCDIGGGLHEIFAMTRKDKS